jgi:hypothetical protein
MGESQWGIEKIPKPIKGYFPFIINIWPFELGWFWSSSLFYGKRFSGVTDLGPPQTEKPGY